jgi:hypothetical protein
MKLEATPTPRNQSLHFANRNRPNSMKTSAEEKFNRYTFRSFEGRTVEETLPPLTFGMGFIGRGGGDRTHDLRLKRPLLYH